MKYVVVTGGVISGVGKGIIASSAGLLLQSIGLVVTCIKIDPYINVDASQMSPLQHGEIYVTDDGGQVDLDIGNYERYLSISLHKENHITTGKIYENVINAERRGDYLGKTVQVVPHVTDAIQDQIQRAAKISVDESQSEPDVCIIELGGTVGDIESSPFIHALAQLRKKVGKENFVQIHVSYIPIVPPGPSGEQKTKPTQKSISDVRGAGLTPDLIACRCETPLHPSTTQKIATMCSVEPEQVFSVHDESTTYHLPILLRRQNLLDAISKHLDILSSVRIPPERLSHSTEMWKTWVDLAHSQEVVHETVSIALVGQYAANRNAYLSISKALEHASMYCHKKVQILWINAPDLADESLEDSPVKYHKAWHDLCSAQGVLVPGEPEVPYWRGMLKAINWARVNHKPFLGIGMGFGLAAIENALTHYSISLGSDVQFHEIWRRTLGPINFNDARVDESMHLGIYLCKSQSGFDESKVGTLYENIQPHARDHHLSERYEKQIRARYRHQQVGSPDLARYLKLIGFVITANDKSNNRPAIIEMYDLPWFVCVRFEPQFTSRVLQPNKIILGFFAASAGCLDEVTEAVQQGRRSFG
ncbi:CTP synthase, partial [Penicillium brevicompactum]